MARFRQVQKFPESRAMQNLYDKKGTLQYLQHQSGYKQQKPQIG